MQATRGIFRSGAAVIALREETRAAGARLGRRREAPTAASYSRGGRRLVARRTQGVEKARRCTHRAVANVEPTVVLAGATGLRGHVGGRSQHEGCAQHRRTCAWAPSSQGDGGVQSSDDLNGWKPDLEIRRDVSDELTLKISRRAASTLYDRTRTLHVHVSLDSSS